jgi:hypothetical protein
MLLENVVYFQGHLPLKSSVMRLPWALNSSVFWVFMQRRLHRRFRTTYQSHFQGSSVEELPWTDVSGQPIGPFFKGLFREENLNTWPLRMGPIGCSETSVLNQPTLPTEDGQIQAIHIRSVRFYLGRLICVFGVLNTALSQERYAGCCVAVQFINTPRLLRSRKPWSKVCTFEDLIRTSQ